MEGRKLIEEKGGRIGYGEEREGGMEESCGRREVTEEKSEEREGRERERKNGMERGKEREEWRKGWREEENGGKIRGEMERRGMEKRLNRGKG